jgi:GAF domain-containing protein
VDKIKDATKADVVVLYPYSNAERKFLPPPFVAGKLWDSSWQEFMIPRRPDDIATLMLGREEPIFVSEGSILYATLIGDSYTHKGNFQQREGVRSTAATRLRVGDEVVGVLFVNFRQPQLFDGPQELLVEGLSHFAAIAINNARMLDKVIQRRLHELEILQKIDHALNRNLDLQSVLDTLIQLTTQEVIPAEEAAILLYDPQTQLLEAASAVGNNTEARQKLKIPYSSTRGITRWVLEHKQSVRVKNVLKDEHWRDIYIRMEARMVSELDVPLFDGEEMIGVLNFESSIEGAFSQEDENFLTTLAGQVVLAVKKAQAYEREKRLAAERRVLNEISKEIIGQLDHRRIFDLILERALELTRSQWGNLMLFDPVQKDLWVANERNMVQDKKDQRQKLDEGIVGYVARTKKLLNVDITRPPWNEIYVEIFHGAQSELAVPMLQGDELRGVLNVESPNPNNFSQVDEELLTGLADLAVITLRNADQYEKATLDARRFSLLYEAGKELGNITEYALIDQVYDVVLRIAGKHCQGQVVIRRYDDEAQELVAIRSSSLQSAPIPFERMSIKEGINGQVARERRMISIYDTRNLPAGVGPAKLSNPDTRSLLVIPILFNERFYGTLAVSHTEIGYFHEEDERFFEALAQELASTIYRLETAEERQEFERRALAVEFMSHIGESAFELTHRLGRDIGIVELLVDNIRSEMQKEGEVNAFVAERLDKIVQAARTVMNLSNKLKSDIAHSSEPGKATGLETTDPRILLEDIRPTIQLPLALPLQIELDIAEDVAAMRVIPSSVIDILRNLIENAINAMPEGGIITLRARNEGRYVALEVIDSGSGIPQHLQSQIFELFFSTKASSGFGLWSARTNAYRNSGNLIVHSQPGQGSTFTLSLPRVDRKVEATS